MPFVNDKLAANQEQLDREKHKKHVSRKSRFHFEPKKVMDLLRSRIVGQDAVLASIEDMLYHVKADFGVDKRPLSVNFLLGPTGVGKTETVRVLAESILGNANKLCRIDMNTLAQEHYAAALTGAPPGYVGSKEGHTLFDAEVIAGSFSMPGIVLFDEIEKASTEVIRALLNVLDTGRLVLSAGTKEIDFSNAMIFMTSNVGAKELRAYRESRRFAWFRFGQTPKQEKHILKRALQKHFDPEFLNRIDRMLSFEYLNKQWLDKILDVELDKLNARLNRRHASLSLSKEARNKLYSYYDEEYGARNLAQQMRVKLEPSLARAMLDDLESEHFEASYSSDRGFVITATEHANA